MKQKYTVEQLENILIDAGLVYINYGLETEKMIGLCSGENVFKVEAEYREIEINGLMGKTKGTKRKIREDASLSVSLIELDNENLKLAFPGANIVENKITNGFYIENSDYIDNITLIGETLGDKYKKITIYNAMSEEGIEISLSDKEEAIVSLNFSAHYDITGDNPEQLWEIEDLTTLAEV